MSIITRPIERLGNAIKRTASYESMIGRSSSGKVIYHQVKGRTRDGRDAETKQQTKESRPIVLIKPDYGEGVALRVIGSRSSVTSNGTLDVYVECNVSDFAGQQLQSDEELIDLWAKFVETFVFETVTECLTQDGTVLGMLNEMRVLRIGRSPQKESTSLGDYFGADLRVTWGTNAV